MNSQADLSVDELQRIVTQQVSAGVLDPVTFAPLVSIEDTVSDLHRKSGESDGWRRVVIKKKREFEMPSNMINPKFLASGGYGCVAECWFNDQKVAVKKVPVPKPRNEDDVFRLLREVIILRKIQEENRLCLTPLIELYTNTDCTTPEELKHIYMVMPLYSPGCLEDVKVSTPELFRTIASHSLEGLHWLHEHGILHRDIKRENIFYDEATNRAVLGDVGSARRLVEGKMTGKKEVGTRCYLAPEFLADLGYGYASDIWSLGCVWFEMLCLEIGEECMFPFDVSESEVLAKQKAFCRHINPALHVNRRATSSNENMVWSRMTWNLVDAIENSWQEPAYRRVLLRMFVFDQAKRASTAELYKDPFFAALRPDTVNGPVGHEIDILDYEEARTALFELRTLQPPKHRVGPISGTSTGSGSCDSNSDDSGSDESESEDSD